MNHFPVSKSILSDSALADFIQKQYALGDKIRCRLIKTWVNDTYLITANNTNYIFRVYTLNWRTEKEIQEEIRLIALLKQKELPVSFAIRDSNGNYIQQLSAPEGLRFAVLFSFAEGEKFHNLSRETHFEMGIIMAKIHQQTHNLELDRIHYTAEVLLKDSFTQIQSLFTTDCEEYQFLSSLQKTLLGEFEKVDSPNIRKGVVHLDIWADNAAFNKANEITIFDFDFCGNGWLCYDIAFYSSMLFATEQDEKERASKMEHFMNGYQSITPISGEELRLIPVLATSLQFFYLGIQCQRFSAVFVNEFHIKRFINLRLKSLYQWTIPTNSPAII